MIFLDPKLSKIVRKRFLQSFFTLTKHNNYLITLYQRQNDKG